MATFSEDTLMTTLLVTDPGPGRYSEKLQSHFAKIQNRLKRWKINVNADISCQITFTTRRAECPQVNLNNTSNPVNHELKCLELRQKWLKRTLKPKDGN